MDTSKIPANEEHIQAMQSDIDKRRADIKSKMSPFNAETLEMVEKFSQTLTDRNVPFMLMADVHKEGYGVFHFQNMYSRKFEDRCVPEAADHCWRNVSNFHHNTALWIAQSLRIKLFSLTNGTLIFDSHPDEDTSIT